MWMRTVTARTIRAHSLLCDGRLTMGSARYPKVLGYQLVERIGGGAFSSVYRAVNVDEEKVAACKVITINEKTTHQDRKNFEKEMRVHATLKHPNVLEFIGAITVELRYRTVYHPGIYMLLELAGGGELFDKIVPDKGIEEELAHVYFHQLITGVEYIHKQGICHRDLKPENILLDYRARLKISDFGLCAVYRIKDTGETRRLTERCGSLPYVAPELERDGPYHAEPVDVWGCGVVLFTLLVGNTPWDEPTLRSPEFARYTRGTIFQEDPWTRISAEGLSLLRGMLDISPDTRMTLADVYRHPWLTRSSQYTGVSPDIIAERLTSGLCESGDARIAAPEFDNPRNGGEYESMDGYPRSQFTQTLQLFSQNNAGTRSTPNLTRFYCKLEPEALMTLIQTALGEFKVEWKLPPGEENGTPLQMRIGGFDERAQVFKGWVKAEAFSKVGYHGTFVIMTRDLGCPISWRRLWKGLILSPLISPHVLFKDKS